MKISHILLLAFTLNFYPLFSYAIEKSQKTVSCNVTFHKSCDLTFKPTGAIKSMHYYSSLATESNQQPTSALIVIHGFKHNVQKAFNAGLQATKLSNKLKDTIVIAPIFYADELTMNYKSCVSDNTPKGNRKKNLVWSCHGWLEGAPADNDANINSFDALDELIGELHRKWPSIKNVTVAGFSAGGQFVQRYVGYAQTKEDIHIRYVIADPSSWLYFDLVRPILEKNGEHVSWQSCLSNNMDGCDFKMATPDKQMCPNYDHWKYGIQNMPAYLTRPISEVKSVYAKADVYYIEGALDSNNGENTFYNLLDKSCAAELQGPYRLQRGLSFAAYDRALIAPDKQRKVIIIPSCAHDPECVFSSKQAQSILFDSPSF